MSTKRNQTSFRTGKTSSSERKSMVVWCQERGGVTDCKETQENFLEQ